jgi:hypothetical protein
MFKLSFARRIPHITLFVHKKLLYDEDPMAAVI